MLFTETRFLFFFAAVFVAYWWAASDTARKWLLLLASYAFYAAWNWRFLGLIVASTGIDFAIGLRLGDRSTTPAVRRRWVLLSVAWNLGVLAFFKYFNFGLDSATTLLNWVGLHADRHTLAIILPVGISFFTFQSMSYSIDVYTGTLRPCRSLLDFATFIGFFPQLFAGPIVRAIDFLPQLDAPRRLADVRGRAMLVLFLLGYFKKAVVADNLAPVVDAFFKHPEHYNWLGCWTAVLFYAAQIYCDFSGYTDMAIAAAGLLGYEFCRNFEFPYLSPNIGEFWRRWHMSLSSWLRDYLYIPLGGNRGGRLYVHRNLMLTMLLGGLWHGAAWTFVAWGGLQGGALVAHREYRRGLKAVGWDKPVGRVLPGLLVLVGTAVTFWWACLSWIFFRSTDGFRPALSIARSFATFRSRGPADFGLAAVGVFAGLVLVHFLASRAWLAGWWAKVPAPLFAAGCGVAFASILPWTPLRYAPFIYFQF